MWPPRTPSKKGTEKFLPIPSPYFSSASIRVAPEHIIHTLFKPECMASPEDSPENLKEESDTLHNDPLFFYYFRAFLRLYRQLTLLKPVMIQESVADDPWKLLISVTLLNKTTGKLAIPVFWDILNKWPTPFALSQANEAELIASIQCLGTQNVRAKRLIKLSRAYLRDPPRLSDPRPSRPVTCSSSIIRNNRRYPPTPISHLPGTGSYALDSYRIFCNHPSEEWKAVNPDDKELIRYLRWKWAFAERQEWIPKIGVVRPVNLSYLELLVAELTEKLYSSTQS